MLWNIAAGVASGTPVLDKLPTKQGAVAYLALEDNVRRAKTRLSKTLGDREAPTDLHVFLEWPRLHEGAVGLLEQWLDDHSGAGPHGIAQLENGMYLSVGDSGIWRSNPASGYSATLIRSGTGFRMAHRATISTTPPACPADIDNSAFVNVDDLLDLLTAWGICPPTCPEDIDGNGNVNVDDLLVLLAAWGPCE